MTCKQQTHIMRILHESWHTTNDSPDSSYEYCIGDDRWNGRHEPV